MNLKSGAVIDAMAIAKRLWMQFYVRGVDAKRAAERAATVTEGSVLLAHG
jgi:hypothetical protein